MFSFVETVLVVLIKHMIIEDVDCGDTAHKHDLKTQAMSEARGQHTLV